MGKSELEKQVCRCVSCPSCRGTGRLWRDGGINAPFDEDYPCDHCHGSAIVETCDRCLTLMEMDQDADPWS